MTTHAYFAPSASRRWMHCTAAPDEEAKAADRGSSYSDRGDRLHKLSDKILTEGEFVNGDTWHWSPGTGEEFDALSEQVDRDSVMDYVNLVASRKGTKFYEIKTEWLPNCGGVSDAVIITRNRAKTYDLEIIDAKFGLNVREYAKENTQLMIYAFGVMECYSAAFDFRNVTLTVAQTGVENGISSWEMKPAVIKKWQALIRARKEQIEAGDVEYNPDPEFHICGWCKAKNDCPGRNDLATKAARGDFFGKDEDELTWAEKYEMAGNLMSIAKGWVGEAKRLMLAGEIEIPGKIVVEGSRSRAWTGEGRKAAKNLLEGWGFDETQLYTEPTFATPPQADALVNKDKATAKGRKTELEECYAWSTGAPTITDESKAGNKKILRKEDLARRDFAEHIEPEEGPED